jgi:hypothetical protein
MPLYFTAEQTTYSTRNQTSTTPIVLGAIDIRKPDQRFAIVTFSLSNYTIYNNSTSAMAAPSMADPRSPDSCSFVSQIHHLFSLLPKQEANILFSSAKLLQTSYRTATQDLELQSPSHAPRPDSVRLFMARQLRFSLVDWMYFISDHSHQPPCLQRIAQ